MNSKLELKLDLRMITVFALAASLVQPVLMRSSSDRDKSEWIRALEGVSGTSKVPKVEAKSVIGKVTKPAASKKSSQRTGKTRERPARAVASTAPTGQREWPKAFLAVEKAPTVTPDPRRLQPTQASRPDDAARKKSEWVRALAVLETETGTAENKPGWVQAKVEERVQPVVEPKPTAKPRAEVVNPDVTNPVAKSDTSIVAAAIDPRTQRQSEPKVPAKKESAGIQYGEDWPKWLKVGFQYRGRGEGPSGIGFSQGSSNSYYLNRVRVEASIIPTSWMRFFLQGQDAQVFAYGAAKPSSMVDTFDLRQAYVDFGKPATRGLSLRVGRQELIYGGQRLVGASEWGNVARSFDAARLVFFRPGIKADVFASSVVQSEQGRFDHHKPGENFYGTYVVLDKLVTKATLEPYFFWKTLPRVAGERGDTADSDVFTGGVRFVGKLPLRFDYTLEVADQWGSFASDRLSAWAGTYQVGWTINASELKPRLHAEFSHASGDSSSQDGRRGTFDQLFPTNHAYYGIGDQVGWRNMRNVKLGFEFNPVKKVRIQTDFHEFYLASTQDGLYNAGGARIVLNRLATSSHVGSEADFQLVYLISKELSVGAGVGHLVPGEYLKQSGKNGGYTFPYLMWNVKF
jgi:alginate export protein